MAHQSNIAQLLGEVANQQSLFVKQQKVQ